MALTNILKNTTSIWFFAPIRYKCHLARSNKFQLAGNCLVNLYSHYNNVKHDRMFSCLPLVLKTKNFAAPSRTLSRYISKVFNICPSSNRFHSTLVQTKSWFKDWIDRQFPNNPHGKYFLLFKCLCNCPLKATVLFYFLQLIFHINRKTWHYFSFPFEQGAETNHLPRF